MFLRWAHSLLSGKKAPVM